MGFGGQVFREIQMVGAIHLLKPQDNATFILRMHPVLNLLRNVIPRDDRCVTALFDRQEDISHYFWPDYIDVYHV
jgi:hypothetical protein